MEYTCDECYALRQPHICICMNCGKKTMISVVKGISAVSKCTGIGSRVAFYYRPSAVIREYIAVHAEKKHAVIMAVGWVHL